MGKNMCAKCMEQDCDIGGDWTCHETRRKAKKAKPEKKYLILELLKEDAYTSSEWCEEVQHHVRGDQEFEFEKNAVLIEWLPGTRFFRVPASIFFTEEVLNEGGDGNG
jgi:hypothetical protein